MKGLGLIILFAAILHQSYSQNPTYQQILSQTNGLLATNGIFGNNSLQTILSSSDFLQLAQTLSQSTVLNNAITLVSNFSNVQQLLLSSNFSQLQNIDLSSLPINLQQVRDAVSDFSTLKVSTECVTRSVDAIVGLGSRQQWALRMLDASAKIPTDLMNYNLDFWGSFDECVKIEDSKYDIRGQYCTAHMPLPIPQNPLPSTPYLQLGLCVPDVCKGDDITKMINWLLSMVPSNMSLALQNTNCQMNNLEYDTKAIAMLIMCGVFLLVMTVGTIYDITMIQWPRYKNSKTDLTPEQTTTGSKAEVNKTTLAVVEDGMSNGKHDTGHTLHPRVTSGETKVPIGSEEKFRMGEDSPVQVVKQHIEPEVFIYNPGMLGKLLLSFSVYTNGRKLLNTKQSSGALTALNGIRFLSMSWVVLGHTFGFGAQQLKNITTFYPAMLKRVSFQAIFNALVSVDSFFTLSGLLLTYLVMKEMKKNQGKGRWPKFWFMFYFHRFWRLTPAYMLVLGVYISLGKYFYDGPKWSQAGITGDEQFCAESWWLNLLYVNNFFKPEKLCMGWSWYLANDMQFYVLSPIMLVPLFFFPVAGIIVTFLVLISSTVTTGVLSKINQWPPSIMGGGEHSAGDMFIDYYIKPYCRIGPYIVGMLTGYILYKTKCKVNNNRYINLLIWIVAIVLACLVLYGLYDQLNGNPLNDDISVLYLATHRTIWGACVSWVAFACATGYGGFVNTLLSWNAFVHLSRLTYCAYLIHPVIITLYNQSLRVQQYGTELTLVYLFVANLVLSNLGAFVVSLAFEAPMMGIEKVILHGQRK